jgi:hypothetical protein
VIRSSACACISAAAAALLLVAIEAVGTPASARAASYMVTGLCSPGATPGGFTPANQDPTALLVGNMCGQGGTPAAGPDPTFGQTDVGAMFAEDLPSNPPAAVANLTTAGWELTAPAGTAITSLSYYASDQTGVYGGGDGWFAGWMADGQPLGGSSGEGKYYCVNNALAPGFCQVLDNRTALTASGLSASTLFFGIGCEQVEGAPVCHTALTGQSPTVEADLYSAAITINDPASPTVTNEAGGIWQSGTTSGSAVPLSFIATDPAGIQSVQVLGPPPGNAVLASQTETCDFTQAQPCPELPSGQIQVDTTKLANGPASVRLAVTNTAGTTTTVSSPTFTVVNGAVVPENFSAMAAGPGSDVIDLTWSAPTPPQGDQFTGAFAQLCPSTGACGQAQQLPNTSGSATITAPGPGVYTVRLWLADKAGKAGSQHAATTLVQVGGPTGPSGPTGPTGNTGPTGPCRCPAPGTARPDPISTTRSAGPAPVWLTSTPSRTDPNKARGTANHRCRGKCLPIRLLRARYAHGRLTIKIGSIPRGDRVEVTLTFRHRRQLRISERRARISIRSKKPIRVLLRLYRDQTPVSRPLVISLL